ncbi:MAG: alpha/beta hydrolase-fold protein [Bacteroidota bacterium]
MRPFVLLLQFFWLTISVDAQTLITGVVVDKDHQTAMPYTNIGIKHKNIGTISGEDGRFSIQIPQLHVDDTLSFFMIGYEELHVPVRNILHSQTFQIQAKKYTLAEVPVSANRLVERSFGIKKHYSPLHFSDGSLNQDDIFEIAQVIHLPQTLSKISSLNLFINQSINDSGLFRINFYAVEDNRPGKRIITKNILQCVPIKEGWLTFDLATYNIYLKGTFIIALEFIPTKENKNISYEVKIGGSAQSFVRSSSMGKWQVPPHHYRMYVTALLDDTKHHYEQNDSEEKESTPSVSLYSQFVNDSFSVFIHLPKSYSRNKQQRFPVVYLLDANVFFDLIARAMDERKLNQTILVGIGYKDFRLMDSLRNRDYTFPRAVPKDSFSISGGGDQFLSFINRELISFIDKTYHCDTTNRTLMGHSLGGYFTLYALQQELLLNKKRFKNFVSASPSLNYGDGYLLKQFSQLRDISCENSKKLFLSFGRREDMEDYGTGTPGLDDFHTLIKLFKTQFKSINVIKEVYPNYGHMETAVPSFLKAIEK